VKWYAIEAFGFLIWSEFQMKLQNGGSVLQDSQLRGSSRRAQVHAASIEELCRAMDIACFLYPKRVLCLQRAAATRALLALHRIEAKVIIGVQMLPFKSHAWVEVKGLIVNDKPYMREIYKVLEGL
jgi:hypothetical protein